MLDLFAAILLEYHGLAALRVVHIVRAFASARAAPMGAAPSCSASLTELFAALPSDAAREDYGTPIVQENALGKRTDATRLSSRQCLNEMYGLDPRLALFRVLRHLWRIDPPGQPLLAMLCALARDPLLCSTTHPVPSLSCPSCSTPSVWG